MHTIDAKNRMSLPAGFRQELHRRDPDRAPILTNAHECLELHPFSDWEEYERQIVSMATIDPKAQAYTRMMVSGAVECPIDKQGRILVPPHLREFAQLDREVTVAGVGTKIELWDAARFATNLIHTQANYEDVAHELAKKLEPGN